MAIRCVDKQLGLRPRDQRPPVNAEGQCVEFLESPDIGDRLPRLAPRDGLFVGRPLTLPERRLRMCEDDGPVDAQDVGEEQLGVEQRRLGPGSAKPLRCCPDRLRDGASARDQTRTTTDRSPVRRSTWTPVEPSVRWK